MIKGKELLGRNVVAIDTGERIDSVRDLVFDHQANQLLGLLVDEGGWFRAARVVPFEAVRSFGEDAIMVDSHASVTTTREDGRLAEVLDSKVSLAGLTLLTTDGENLGKIADVYFDEHSGQVEGYEATGGLFSDLSNGRTYVPAPEAVQIGEDAAIVPVSVAEAMREQEMGGLRGAYQNATENLKQNYGDIAQATKERQKEYVVGKTAGHDITLDDGTVLIHRGDVVTAQQADQAEAAGKLTALATAATGGVLSGAYDTARERVQGGVDSVREATAQRQKESIVGRVAEQDVTVEVAEGVQEVIVHGGETITAHHVARAEQAGRLGALVAAAGGAPLQGGGATDTTVVARAQPVAASQAETVEDTVGRRVRSDVRAPGGSLLAAQGQIVTPAIAARARDLGIAPVLIAATHPQTGGARTTETLAGGLDRMSAGTSNLLDRARAWLGDRRDEASDALEQRQQEQQAQRIRDALGRPVTRVILAPDDSIILNVGEIITHKAVDAARAGDVLDILLDSVSKEEPDINPLNVRPHETGRAALEGQPDPTAPQSTGGGLITDPNTPPRQG